MTSITAPSRWAKPSPDVTGLDTAFGARDLANLMPAYGDIPAEFKRDRNTWVRFQQEWFFCGIAGATVETRDGVDAKAALRHLKAIQSSWEPKHEHKEAAVAYLASLWFVRVAANGKTFGED